MSFKADIDGLFSGSRKWVASRRWAAADGFHHLNGGNRPLLDVRADESCSRKQTFDGEKGKSSLS
jgi:hypothetical protein